MKVDKFNVQKACNVPKKLSLVNPFSGETIIDDEGNTLDVFVYGIKSSIARNAVKDRDRKYGNIKKMTPEQQSKSGAEFLATLTQGWTENIENDNGAYKSAVDMYLEQDWIAEQVQDFAMKLDNFDPNA
jgi:hypothetical protein